MENQTKSLIDADDSVLIVIDAQDDFLEKLEPKTRTPLIKNICWLVEVARWKKIPLVVTAEEYDTMPLSDQLAHVLPSHTHVFNKLVFGLADQAEILDAVEQTGRKTAILIGLETDVCVTHSALGLLDRGYRVVAVIDATGTPNPNHEIGLQRMSNAGVILVNTKGLFYEWLRTVEMIQQFHNELPHMREKIGIPL